MIEVFFEVCVIDNEGKEEFCNIWSVLCNNCNLCLFGVCVFIGFGLYFFNIW